MNLHPYFIYEAELLILRVPVNRNLHFILVGGASPSATVAGRFAGKA
jgi:hypothetical protein